MAEKNKPHRKKEMDIKMKSEPLKNAQGDSNRPVVDQKRKPHDFKKKGTRGSSWIG